MYRPEDTLEIDVDGIETPQELHHLLFKAFRFPDYYGNNWDAFDECISDVEVPGIVRIVGFGKLRALLPRDAGLLANCLRHFVEHHEPKIKLEIS